jgi:oligosaccharyltransferase complex subunit alpha (ribophorin I)
MKALSLLAFCLGSSSSEFVNTNVHRKFNFDRGYLFIDTEIAFSGSSVDNKYYHVLPKDQESNIGVVAARSLLQDLKVEKVERPSHLEEAEGDFVYFSIELTGTQENHRALEIQEIYKRRLEPFPNELAILHEQLVRVDDSKHFLSAYRSEKEKLTVAIESNKVRKFTQDDLADAKQRSLKYGPYQDVAPYTYEPLMVHFEYNKPMPIFLEAETQIVVSHWGNIAIDEYFILKNEAAKIKGEYSRADYFQVGDGVYSAGDTSIKTFHTEYPRHIHDLYYYDFIGNISSSHAYRNEERVEFELQPRFHIFGQWKTDWH